MHRPISFTFSVISLGAAFVLIGLSSVANAQNLAPLSKTRLKITSIAPNRICGVVPADTTNQTVCLPDKPSTATTLGKVTALVSSGAIECARSLSANSVSATWTCWGGTTDYSEKNIKDVLAVPLSKPFNAGVNLCSISPTTVTCTTRNRYEFDENGISSAIPSGETLQKFGSFAGLKSAGGSDSFLCVIDGEAVKCRSRYSTRPLLPKSFLHPRLVAATDFAICIVDDEGMKCQGNQASVTPAARPDWKDALFLRAEGHGICALLPGGKIECEQPATAPNEALSKVPNDLGAVSDFAIGRAHMCALSVAGKVTCWGGPGAGKAAEAPIGTASSVAQLAVSETNACALSVKGAVSCWGANDEGQLQLPLQQSSPVQIAVGEYASCAWNLSGIRCVGDYQTAQINETLEIVTASVARNASSNVCVIEKSPGLNSRNLTEHTALRCWSGSRLIQTPPPELADPVLVATESGYACAASKSSLRCWGSDTATPKDYPERTSGVKKLVVGPKHACIIDDYGLACWGEATPVPDSLARAGSAIDVAVGSSHTCALTYDHQVSCWGDNGAKQLNVPHLSNPFSIAAIGNSTCASDDHGLICWGAPLQLSAKPQEPPTYNQP